MLDAKRADAETGNPKLDARPTIGIGDRSKLLDNAAIELDSVCTI